MLRTLNIPIPARNGAPKTTIFVKIIAQDEMSLKTKPYIFMLPGGPGANHSHYKDYSCLEDVGNIVFSDPRGCGLSEKGNAATYTMDNYIQDIDIIRQYLQLEKIILLGKSCGAMCALIYTLSYPNIVSQLILAAGSPSFKFLETAKNNLLTRGTTDEQNELCEKMWQGTFINDNEVERFIEVMATFYSYKKRHGQSTNRPLPDLATL
jgi:proline iminopeptidase